MLKRRIIPVELLHSGRLVKSVGFGDARDVGDPIKSSQVYSDQDADELVLIQIDRDCHSIECLVQTVKNVAEHCFVPLTVGGGISSMEDVERLFDVGADKVLLNSAAYSNLSLISEISNRFGRQALVISIDVRCEDGNYVLYSNGGRSRQRIDLFEHIENIVNAGAGELMIQVIDRDGMMVGYDLDLFKRVVSRSNIPVIACSGAGNFIHLKEAFETGVDAVACGSLFNFGDNNPLRAKAFLKNYGIPLKKI